MKASKAGCRRNRNLTARKSVNPFDPPKTQAEARSQLAWLDARMNPDQAESTRRRYVAAKRLLLNNICSLPAG